MAYRTQSTRSQYRDVSPSEEDNSYAREITAAATAFLGGELISLGKRNAERKQVNNALMLQSEANRVKLMTDVGKLATLENEVNRDELKIAGSTVVKDFSDAQLRVNRSTGTYIYKDPLTGQEITREDDLKTIDQSNDWLSNIGGDIEASETLIAGIQDLYQAGKIGNKPGDLDIGATDPRALAVAIGEGVTEKYKVKKNKDGLYETTVEYSGKAIAEANKAEGVSGDTWTIDTKSLAEALNDPTRNPKNMLAYVASNDYTQNGGLFDSEKNAITNEGTLKPEFFENIGETTISVGGGKRQKVSQDRLKINEVESAVYASSSAAAGSTMRGNNPQQVITDIKSYTRYDKEKNEYYYNTPLLSTTKDPETGEEITEGYLQYDDKGAVIMNKERTVVMKDNQLMIDQENLKPELTEMYSQYQLGNLGAYDNRRNTPIGNAYDASEPTKDPTRKQIATGAIEDFRRNVKLATEEGAFNPPTFDKKRVDNIAGLISGVYGGGKAVYDDKNKLFIIDKAVVYAEDGTVLTKGETISFEYDTADPNALDRLIQKLETSLATTTDGTKKEIIIGKSSPEEMERERKRDKRNKFNDNFPNLRLGYRPDDDMLEEGELAKKLKDKYPTLKIEEPLNPTVESIRIGGVLVSDALGNYNPEDIMDIVYEQLNKSKEESKSESTKTSEKTQTGGEKTLAEKMKEAIKGK